MSTARVWRPSSRTRRIALVVFAVGALAALTPAGLPHLLRWWFELPSFVNRPGEVRALRLPMRDGVHLATSVHTPRGEGPWPTLLVRSPYNPVGVAAALCRLFTRYDYACVYQDVRGRYGSEGEWEPMAHERDDGLDTLQWLVAQPFHDGNIGLFGMSYLAAVQWVMADALPPEVKTMVPMVFGTDLYATVYRDGLLQHEVVTAWAASGPDHTLEFDGEAYQSALRHRPFNEVDTVYFGKPLDWFRRMLASPGRADGYWQDARVQKLSSMPERARVPMLMIAAWYDFSVTGQVASFEKLPRRAESKLVIGPWHHLQGAALEPAPASDRGLGAQAALVHDWLAHHLKGAPLHTRRGDVETYTIGADAWHRWERWPPATETVPFYLGGLNAAGTCPGGALEDTPPSIAAEARYTYDPAHPRTAHGGNALLAFTVPGFDGVTPGSLRQEPDCERTDVLRFVGAPVSAPWHIAGGGRVVLAVRSSAPDTAFVVRLLEEDTDGARVNIREGATTLAYRNGAEGVQPYTSGDLVEVQIELPPIDWRIAAGRRLVLEVTSSNVPMWHPHNNRAGLWSAQTDAVVAEQTITTSIEHPARLELPIWRGALEAAPAWVP